MFDRLTKRMVERAKAVADDAHDRLEGALSAVPGIRVRREGEVLVIKGRGLIRRWIGDVRLRHAWWAER